MRQPLPRQPHSRARLPPPNKTSRTLQLIKTCLIILIGLLFVAPANALPPRQHLLRGEITAVDRVAGTFTVQARERGEPILLAWNETTRIREGSLSKPPADLARGPATAARAGFASDPQVIPSQLLPTCYPSAARRSPPKINPLALANVDDRTTALPVQSAPTAHPTLLLN